MKKVVVFLMLTVLFLAACQIRPQGRDFSGFDIAQVRKGTEGLTGVFRENAPPETVRPDQRFRIILGLHNKGAYDIDRGHYTLFGFGPDELFVEPKSDVYSIRGRTLSDPVGQRISTRAEGVAKFSRDIIPLKAFLCYPYQTIASTQICIDADPHDEKNLQKPCKVTDTPFSGGQGGPVGITRIETLPMNEHLDFPERMIPEINIYFDNFGAGNIVDLNKLQDVCRGTAPGKQIVDVEAVLSNQRMSCEREVRSFQSREPTIAKGDVEITEQKEAKITCTLPEGIDIRAGTYTAPLTITMKYGYQDFISTEINVENRE